MAENNVEKLVHDIDREIIKRLSQRKHKDFRAELKDVFALYLKLLKTHQIQNALGEEYPLSEIPSYIRRVKQWCKDLGMMIDGHYEGDLLKTIKVYNKLFRKTSKGFMLWFTFPMVNIDTGSVWYRGRRNENKERWDKKQLFHVPFGQRGKIGSQRFSILGFPCLYLASSLNCCLGELRDKTPITISAFKLFSKIKVYDLSFFPSILSVKDLWSYLFLYPIKIACSIPSPKAPKDCREHHFIPEYIVPEYVLHGTIKQARNTSESLGFVYTSTSVFSEDVTKEEVRKSTNLVIPVVNIKDKGYCDKLCKMLSMTAPRTLDISDNIDDKDFENQEEIFKEMAFDSLPDTEESKDESC